MDQVESASDGNTAPSSSLFSHRPKRRKPRGLPWNIRLIKHTFRVFGPLFPTLLSGLAYRLWLSTRRFPAPRREQRALEAAQRYPLEVAGTRVSAWSIGEGPPVLFVHGWNGRGGQFVQFIKPLLAQGYSVVGFDAPGHGESEGKASSGPQIVETLRQLQARHGPFEAIVSHSFGVLCSAMALANGFEARCLVGISAPASVEGLLEKFAGALDIPEPVSEKLFARFTREFGADVIERFSTEKNAGRLQVPGLIIHDEYDTIVSWWEGRRIAEAYPGAQFLLTTGLGHSRVLRNANVVDSTVEFIARAGEGNRQPQPSPAS